MQQLRQATSSSFSFVRRNRRIIAVLGATAAAAGATFAYFGYRYNQVVGDGLRQEREAGLQHLWRQYEVNEETVQELMNRLVSLMRKVVWARTPAEELVDRLRRKDDGIGIAEDSDNGGIVDRKSLWERLKTLSFVRLLSSTWAIALVHLQLVARINLVARYAGNSGATGLVDAPVKALPGGRLSIKTQKAFLEMTRKKLFEDGHMHEIVTSLEKIVEEIAGGIPLTEKVGREEMKALLRRISKQFALREENNILSARYMMSDTETCVDSDADNEEMAPDENLIALQEEICDLCELLDFRGVLESSVEHIIEQIDKEIEKLFPEDSLVPLAKAVPFLINISDELTTVVDKEDVGVTNVSSSNDNKRGELLESVFVALSRNPPLKRFAAATFLSGEQDYGATNN